MPVSRAFTPGLRAVAPLFRAPFLRNLIAGRHVKQLREAVSAMGEAAPRGNFPSLGAFFDALYRKLQDGYTCEYVVKNELAHQLFLQNHPSGDALFTEELRSRNSRADVVVVNGTSTVYEIKTEFDTLSKLQGQLSDYSMLFDRICVVVPPIFLDRVFDIAPPYVGVISFCDSILQTIREPISNKERIDPGVAFGVMRRAEYVSAIQEAFGCSPEVPNTRMYAACRELFMKLDSVAAHDLMISQLRKRGRRQLQRAKGFPNSLLHTILTTNSSDAFFNCLRNVLNDKVAGLCSSPICEEKESHGRQKRRWQAYVLPLSAR